MRMRIICGPPCAGKTTLAHQLAQPGDLVLDFDTIARELGSPVQWLHPQPWRTQAEREMRTRMNAALEEPSPATAWAIRGAPLPQQRARLAKYYGPTYLLDPGIDVCIDRARAERARETVDSITKWYRWHRPWSGDRDARLLLGPTTFTVDLRQV